MQTIILESFYMKKAIIVSKEAKVTAFAAKEV